jgi:LmbE family N-acetylglucosaminyl deacetylase
VFAHPDDESVACGGVLARCAAEGARVVLICATHGENRAGKRDLALFETRAEELQRAAEALGIAEVVLLDYPDGFLPWVDVREFAGKLASEIRRVNPTWSSPSVTTACIGIPITSRCTSERRRRLRRWATRRPKFTT